MTTSSTTGDVPVPSDSDRQVCITPLVEALVAIGCHTLFSQMSAQQFREKWPTHVVRPEGYDGYLPLLVCPIQALIKYGEDFVVANRALPAGSPGTKGCPSWYVAWVRLVGHRIIANQLQNVVGLREGEVWLTVCEAGTLTAQYPRETESWDIYVLGSYPKDRRGRYLLLHWTGAAPNLTRKISGVSGRMWFPNRCAVVRGAIFTPVFPKPKE